MFSLTKVQRGVRAAAQRAGEVTDAAIARAKRSAKEVVVAAMVATASAGAMAQDAGAIDTSGVTKAIVAAGAAVAVIGAAVLLVKIGIKVWKWLSGAA